MKVVMDLHTWLLLSQWLMITLDVAYETGPRGDPLPLWRNCVLQYCSVLTLKNLCRDELC